METKTDDQKPNNGQLILVPHRDTVRLLEVYVKRSLSLNDGALGAKSPKDKQKWVTKRQRRHSSDPSLHLAEGLTVRESDPPLPVAEPPAKEPQPHPEEPVLEKSTKKSKKNKKPSFWKSITSFFSRKSSDNNNEEQDSPSDTAKDSATDDSSDPGATCLPTTPVAPQKKKSLRRKSIKRRFSRKRLSITKPYKPDITEIEGKFWA